MGKGIGRWTLGTCAVGAISAALSCTNQDGNGGSFGFTSSPLGEPNGDYPGYNERVVLYATNKARTDPSAENWPAYPAQPPFQYNYDLNRSSRAHSLDMATTPCFQHES